jgi:hypothetical protein
MRNATISPVTAKLSIGKGVFNELHYSGLRFLVVNEVWEAHNREVGMPGGYRRVRESRDVKQCRVEQIVLHHAKK